MKLTLIALLAFSFLRQTALVMASAVLMVSCAHSEPPTQTKNIDTFEEWREQYIRIHKGEKLKRPLIFKQDNQAIRKDFVRFLNMGGLEAIHSGAGGLPKDKKKWMTSRMVWAAGDTLYMANPSDFLRGITPEVTVNKWKKGIDVSRKDKDDKIPPEEKYIFDFALQYFDRLTFVRRENPFARNSKIIYTDLSLEFGDGRDKIKPSGLGIDTFEGWAEEYGRINKGTELMNTFFSKHDSRAIRKDFVRFVNMAGLKSIHPTGLPKDKNDWLIDRMVWAEGGHLFTINPTDIKEVDHKGTAKMWEDGLNASRKSKGKKVPRKEEVLFDFVLFYFDKLTIISCKAPYDSKSKDDMVELSLEFGDGRDKIKPH